MSIEWAALVNNCNSLMLSDYLLGVYSIRNVYVSLKFRMTESSFL